jgi:hypothetical protein
MATITIPYFSIQRIVSGLNSYVHTITTAGVHKCRIEITNPPASTITCTISQTGSVTGTLATLTLPGANAPIYGAQNIDILQTNANCALNDTITFALSSSSPIDQQLNTVQAKIILTVAGLN